MTDNTDDVQAVEKLGETRDAIVAEVRKAIVGMDDVIDEMMIAIFARGHCLLVGVPGLAKTLLVSSLAKTMGLLNKRESCARRPSNHLRLITGKCDRNLLIVSLCSGTDARLIHSFGSRSWLYNSSPPSPYRM